MRRAKPFWQVVLLAVFGLVLAAFAVFLVRSRAELAARDTGLPSPPLDGGTPAELASALSEIRQRALTLSAPAWRSQRLAIGRGRLVRLGAAECVSLALPGFEEKRWPLAGPRAVVGLPGGSLLAVGERETLRFDPGAPEPVRLARVSFLPGSELLPERRDSKKFWILHRPSRSLVRYDMLLGEHALLPTDRMLELSEGATGAFAAVRDGSWVYGSGQALETRLPEGKPRRFELGGEAPWRFLPGPRIDEVWALSESGEVALYRMLDRPRKVLRFRSADPPFDAAASEQLVGLLTVREGGPRREFRLEVWSRTGTVELETPLGVDEALPTEDWAARVLEREVMLSDEPPLVAVLEPSGVRVWDLTTDQLVYSASAR